MNLLKRFFVALVALGTFGGVGCGGGGVLPNQTFVDQVLGQILTDSALILRDATTCAQADMAASQLHNTTQACSPNAQGVSGSVTYSFNPFPPTCDDGPPFTLSTVITSVIDNCVASSVDTVYTGTVSTQLNINGDTRITSDSSDGLVVSGTLFTFKNLQATSFNGTTCSGTMNVEGSTCTVSSDCTTCTF